MYRIHALYREPLGAWRVDVDARDGRVHQIQHVLRSLDFTGTISGDVENPGYCEGVESAPLELMEVEVDGVGTDITDADGSYGIPFGGADPESIFVEFRGPYVNVNNASGEDSRIADLATPGVPYDVHWNDDNSRPDERDVFFHEAGGCANTGRIGGVVHHEYGHGVTDFLYGPNDPPGDLHEGNSDIISNYITDDPVIGRGFYLDQCDFGIRNSLNDLRYPEDLTGSGHFDGQILAGFHWDAREDLRLSLGEEAGHARASMIWHFSRVLGLPQTQPEQVWVTVYDGFEAETAWTVGGMGDDAEQGVWELVAPNGTAVDEHVLQPDEDVTPDPGEFAWITGQYHGGYPWMSDADGQTTLLSPIYDLSEYEWAAVRYHRWFQTWWGEEGSMDVDVSNDGGLWITIEHLEGYDPAPAWEPVQVDINDLFFGGLGELQVRVVMHGVALPSVDEGGFDEFVILAGQGMSTIEDGRPDDRSLQLNLEARSLVSGPSRVVFEIPAAGAVQLSIHDLAGRVVRTLFRGTQDAGRRELVWDGLGSSGSPVPSGVYFLRLETRSGTRSHRVVVMR